MADRTKPAGPSQINMTENQVLVFNNGGLAFTCLSGAVWLTDGLGGDWIVESGQQITLSTRGKICIQAFKPSIVQIPN